MEIPTGSGGTNAPSPLKPHKIMFGTVSLLGLLGIVGTVVASVIAFPPLAVFIGLIAGCAVIVGCGIFGFFILRSAEKKDKAAKRREQQELKKNEKFPDLDSGISDRITKQSIPHNAGKIGLAKTLEDSGKKIENKNPADRAIERLGLELKYLEGNNEEDLENKERLMLNTEFKTLKWKYDHDRIKSGGEKDFSNYLTDEHEEYQIFKKKKMNSLSSNPPPTIPNPPLLPSSATSSSSNQPPLTSNANPPPAGPSSSATTSTPSTTIQTLNPPPASATSSSPSSSPSSSSPPSITLNLGADAK
jgi:hypothetical protein